MLVAIAGCGGASDRDADGPSQPARHHSTAASCPESIPALTTGHVVSCPRIVDSSTLAYEFTHGSNCPGASSVKTRTSREVVLTFRYPRNCLLDLIDEPNHQVRLPRPVATSGKVTVIVNELGLSKPESYRYTVLAG
jgi:hypothetical protein